MHCHETWACDCRDVPPALAQGLSPHHVFCLQNLHIRCRGHVHTEQPHRPWRHHRQVHQPTCLSQQKHTCHHRARPAHHAKRYTRGHKDEDTRNRVVEGLSFQEANRLAWHPLGIRQHHVLHTFCHSAEGNGKDTDGLPPGTPLPPPRHHRCPVGRESRRHHLRRMGTLHPSRGNGSLWSVPAQQRSVAGQAVTIPFVDRRDDETTKRERALQLPYLADQIPRLGRGKRCIRSVHLHYSRSGYGGKHNPMHWQKRTHTGMDKDHARRQLPGRSIGITRLLCFLQRLYPAPCQGREGFTHTSG